MTTAFFQPNAQFFAGGTSGGGGGAGGDLGTSWYPLLPLQIPTLADFNTTLAAVGTTTVTADDFGVVITQLPAGATQVRYAYQVAPATPYTVTVALEFLATNNISGVAFRDSGTGRLLAFGATMDFAVFKFDAYRLTNLTTWSATPTAALLRMAPFERSTVLRMTDDGTNLTFFLSPNGFDWVQMYTETRATWCANPTQVGWYSNARGAPGGDPSSTVRCVSWSVA